MRCYNKTAQLPSSKFSHQREWNTAQNPFEHLSNRYYVLQIHYLFLSVQLFIEYWVYFACVECSWDFCKLFGPCIQAHALILQESYTVLQLVFSVLPLALVTFIITLSLSIIISPLYLSRSPVSVAVFLCICLWSIYLINCYWDTEILYRITICYLR